MLDVLPDLASFMWQVTKEVFDLYTTCSVLCGFFVLWLIDRMFGIFDILKK